MKVLIAHSQRDMIGGVERVLVKTVPCLMQSGCDIVLVVSGKGAITTRLQHEGIPFMTWRPPVLRRLRRPDHACLDMVRILQATMSLRSIVHRTNADILHAYDTSSAIAASLYGKFSTVPLIWDNRSHVSHFGMEGRFVADAAARIICHSEAIAQPFRNELPDMQDKIRIVYGAGSLPPPKRSRMAVRKSLGIGGDTFVVLLIGRIRYQKRQHVAIEAMDCVRRRHGDVQLLIVGAAAHGNPQGLENDRRYERAIRTKVDHLHLTEHVHFLGERDDVSDLLHAGDLLICPAVDDACPIVVIEAMGAGVPVVGVDSGGIPEEINHQVEGFILEKDNPGSMADAIMTMAADPSLRLRMGDAGKIRSKRFAPDRIAQDLLRIYQELSSS